MNAKILIALLIIGVIAGCSKDSVNTKPMIKFKSTSTTVVPVNGSLSFEFDFTDKEGDISDTLFMKKVRINKRATSTIRDSFGLRVPDAPNKSKGIIQVDLEYNNFLVSAISPIENDTLVFKFALKDKANNVSDTITSEPIVIIR